MEHQHDRILRIILIDQLTLLDLCAEAAGDIGDAGVGRVAVDIRLDAVFADQHIPVRTCRTCPDNKVLLALAKDLADCRLRLLVGRKAAEGDLVAVMYILGNGIM